MTVTYRLNRMHRERHRIDHLWLPSPFRMETDMAGSTQAFGPMQLQSRELQGVTALQKTQWWGGCVAGDG